jgi:hypothetical protein
MSAWGDAFDARAPLHYPEGRSLGMRAFFYGTMVLIVLAVLLPPGCRRMQEHLLLSLLHDSERPLEILGSDPPTFRFPATAVRAVALIDYDDAIHKDGHVSFVPADGSDRYAWATSVCSSWSSACMEAQPATTVSEITYGAAPTGLLQIEPPNGPARALAANRLYGLALFGDKLFALKAFYRDDAGAFHTMEGWRFAEAVLRSRRDELRTFLALD